MGWHLHLIKTEGTNVSGEGGGAPDMEAPIPGSTKRGRKGGIHKNEKNGQKGQPYVRFQIMYFNYRIGNLHRLFEEDV